MLEQLKSFLMKTLDNMASVKFLILLMASAFFYMGKLDASTWQQTVLTIAGLRAVNEVAGMVADAKAARQKVDDPDAKS